MALYPTLGLGPSCSPQMVIDPVCERNIRFAGELQARRQGAGVLYGHGATAG
jgi:hypothetical protein